ncbi:MAG: sulfurtransferase TusA family protein [Thiomicrospira sp.]|uniref:sulfurtransferase TusA family protein n=1 Tax=Thiomicrospira sp. TaxID=935 RepID=UPI0019EC7FFC|nr:sulfurtransferase TusA family protein [Thiomicrospira sp.]MBE0492918.1 sulfurtransferase TusA family protein [Thiomicrospira sp.]
MFEVDLRGLVCPMPLIRLKKVLVEQRDVAEFKLLLSDRGALKDVPAFCHQAGLDAEVSKDEETLIIWVKRRQNTIEQDKI